MKLTFFEKEVFDDNAIEKPTVSTTFGKDVDNIKSNYKKQFISDAASKVFRHLYFPFEYLPFFTLGEKFRGKIKHANITSGEPEIISNTTDVAYNRAVNFKFKGTANLNRLLEDTGQVEPEAVVDIPARTYEPILNLEVGNLFVQMANGFDAIRTFVDTFINGVKSTRASYINLFSILSSTLADNIYNNSYYNNDLRQETPENQLPRSILEKVTETPITSDIYSIVTKTKLPQFIKEIDVTLYFRFTNAIIRRTDYFKELCFKGSASAIDIVAPAQQKLELIGDQVEQVNVDGTAFVPGVSLPPELSNLSNIFTLVGNNFINGDFRVSSGLIQAIESGDRTHGFIRHDIESRITWLNNLQLNLSSYSYNSIIGLIKRTLEVVNDIQVTTVVETENGYLKIEALEPANYLTANFSTRLQYAQSRATALRTYLTNSNLTSAINNLIQNLRDRVPDIVNSLPDISFNIKDYKILDNTNFITPTLNKTDLGIANTENKIKVNGQEVSDISISLQMLSGSSTTPNPDGNGIYRNVLFKLNQTSFNLNSTKLLTNNTRIGQSAEDAFKSRVLPINIPTKANVSYNVVDIIFDGILGVIDSGLYLQKSDGSLIENREIGNIIYKVNNGAPRTIGFRGSGTRTLPNGEVATVFRSNTILRLFQNRFPEQSAPLISGLIVPDIAEWLRLESLYSNHETIRRLTTVKKTLAFSFPAVVDTSQDIEEERINLLRSINDRFPFVSVEDLYYQSGRMFFVLSRIKEAPIPPKEFFNYVRLNNRLLNFLSSRYKAFDIGDADNIYNKRVAEYSWSASNFLQNLTNIPIELIKNGISRTNEINLSRRVRKSTVETNTFKKYPSILGGFQVSDFNFTDTSFDISFIGSLNANSFSSLALRDKDDKEYITRQMLPNSATITSVGSGTKFVWENYEEFKDIKQNKTYTVEMIKGGSNVENKFFVTRQGINDYHFLTKVEKNNDDMIFTLKKNGSENFLTQTFNSVAIYNTGVRNTPFIAAKLIHELFNVVTEGDLRKFTYKNAFQGKTINANDKFDFNIESEDYDEFSFNILKLTDMYFDTIILLNTNLDDIFLTDILNKPLIHPTDIENIKTETEDGLRHIVYFLKNPITAKSLNIINRRLKGVGDTRKIGRLILTRRIGTFTQMPNIKVFSTSSRITTNSQLNKSHIKTLPNSLNYMMDFPPLDKESDLLLAQDLFNRVIDYDEFMTWISGGDITIKNRGMKGFRFVDIIKSLCANEFEFQYVDGRFSSGINFQMITHEV